MIRLRRRLVVGVAALALGAAYQVLVLTFRILALPRFEIPYIEPGAGLCGFGHYEPVEWVVLAPVALGLSWAPLTWAKRRRSSVARCLAGLAMLSGAMGLVWLLVVGSAVRGILGGMRAWHLGGSLSHPGFETPQYEGLLTAAQVGLGIVTLALALGSLSLRLQRRFRFRAEALAAARAGLLVMLGAALSVRSAWLNDSGCFPISPAFRRDAPATWDGLWTTSVGFYAGCSLLTFVAFPAARRIAWFAAPLALSAIFAYGHASWGPQCECQAVDVPSLPLSTSTTAPYPATRDWSFGPSQAVQLSALGVTWRREQFDGAPAFLAARAREQNRWGEFAELFGPPATPSNLVVRLAPGASLVDLRAVVTGARAARFAGVTFELGVGSWPVHLGWGIEVPSARLLRIPVPFADGCSCQLRLGPDQTADAGLRQAVSQLTQQVCCFGTAAEGR